MLFKCSSFILQDLRLNIAQVEFCANINRQIRRPSLPFFCATPCYDRGTATASTSPQAIIAPELPDGWLLKSS